jgi:AmiR/NasT family two-component response regulator
MSRRPIQNFRGVRAAVILPGGRDRTVIEETLARLGLSVAAVHPGAAGSAPAILDEAELVLFDADTDGDFLPWAPGTAQVPLIAVIGLEAPSRLQRAFELQPAAVLRKPVSTIGIYTALFFAANEHRRRQEQTERLQALEARHAGRRVVFKAVLHLMESRGVDDEHAYRLLRKESMRQRITVEELAARLIAAAGPPAAAREA